MVNQNLISELDLQGTSLDAELASMFGEEQNEGAIGVLLEHQHEDLKAGSILAGKIVGRAGDNMVVDVGLKSEGLIASSEWDDAGSVEVGDEVQVWLETVESDNGHIVLSKRKADRILNWNRISSSKAEGDTVEGRVMRKIKGGLLVDIGYPVFLPYAYLSLAGY